MLRLCLVVTQVECFSVPKVLKQACYPRVNCSYVTTSPSSWTARVEKSAARRKSGVNVDLCTTNPSALSRTKCHAAEQRYAWHWLFQVSATSDYVGELDCMSFALDRREMLVMGSGQQLKAHRDIHICHGATLLLSRKGAPDPMRLRPHLYPRGDDMGRPRLFSKGGAGSRQTLRLVSTAEQTLRLHRFRPLQHTVKKNNSPSDWP